MYTSLFTFGGIVLGLIVGSMVVNLLGFFHIIGAGAMTVGGMVWVVVIVISFIAGWRVKAAR